MIYEAYVVPLFKSFYTSLFVGINSLPQPVITCSICKLPGNCSKLIPLIPSPVLFSCVRVVLTCLLLGVAACCWTDVRRDTSALRCARGFIGRELNGVERQTQVPVASLKALKLQTSNSMREKLYQYVATILSSVMIIHIAPTTTYYISGLTVLIRPMVQFLHQK
jgi:hypothetical protein